MSRQPPGRRADYRWFHAITTRWMDNDVFQHVNNVNYFSFFDTAVTYYEMTSGVVDLLDGPVHCVVAEVMCRYHSSVAFPDRITVGIRVARIGAQFGALRDRRVPQRRRCGGGGRVFRARVRRTRDAAAGAGAGGVAGAAADDRCLDWRPSRHGPPGIASLPLQ